MQRSGWKRAVVMMAGITGVFGSVATAGEIESDMDVTIDGMNVGNLKLEDYKLDKPGNSKTGAIGLEITGNFTSAGGDAEDKLKKFPKGLTYMQTVNLMLDQAWQSLLDKNGEDLPQDSPFADPPQGGYTAPDGTKFFDDDKTPWYSTLEPGMPEPPDVDWNDGPTAQFFDGPNFPLTDATADGDTFNGMLSALNQKNGMVIFETALVGVWDAPMVEDGDDLLKDKYKVEVLKSFKWGINFEFMDNDDGMIDLDDYKLSLKGLNDAGDEILFDTDVSDGFKGAFSGDPMEWNVMFIPAPGTLVLLGLGGLTALRRRHAA